MLCISIDSSITDYQYFPLNGYLMWFVWIWMPHLFLNKRSLFGLTGKGPWGRITHSEYVIRRYELHLKTGVEDRVFARAIEWPVDWLCTELLRYRVLHMWWWIRSGLWISGLQGLLCKCLRFCSSPEQTCMDSMPDITSWDIKPISFKYISVGGGEFILCLTPFFETYELKGYVVEIYQRYIPIW